MYMAKTFSTQFYYISSSHYYEPEFLCTYYPDQSRCYYI
jgi:hypothetical protein